MKNKVLSIILLDGLTAETSLAPDPNHCRDGGRPHGPQTRSSLGYGLELCQSILGDSDKQRRPRLSISTETPPHIGRKRFLYDILFSWNKFFSSLLIAHLYRKFVFGTVDFLTPGLLGSPSRNWGPHNSLDLSWLSPEKFGTCYIYWCYNREIYKQLLNAFLSIFRFLNLLF